MKVAMLVTSFFAVAAVETRFLGITGQQPANLFPVPNVQGTSEALWGTFSPKGDGKILGQGAFKLFVSERDQIVCRANRLVSRGNVRLADSFRARAFICSKSEFGGGVAVFLTNFSAREAFALGIRFVALHESSTVSGPSEGIPSEVPNHIVPRGGKPLPPPDTGTTSSTEPKSVAVEQLQARLAQLFVLGASSVGSGSSVRLREALARIADRSRQESIVKAFWETLAAGMRLGASVQCLKRLKDAPIPQEYAGLEAAFEARLRSLAAEQGVVFRSGQHRLAMLLGSQATGGLPLPADMFVLTEYRTYFEEVYASRDLPLRLRLLGLTLPLRFREVQLAARSLEAAEDWWDAVRAGLAEGRVSGAMLFRALEELQRQEQALIESVCRYNQEIAEYALGVAEAGLAADTLAWMLIGKRATQPEVAPVEMRAQLGEGASPLSPPTGVTPATHTAPSNNLASDVQLGWQKLPPTGSSSGNAPGSSPTPQPEVTPGGLDQAGLPPVSIQTQPVVPVEETEGRAELSIPPPPLDAPPGGESGLSSSEMNPSTPGRLDLLQNGKFQNVEREHHVVQKPVLTTESALLRQFPGLQVAPRQRRLPFLAELLFQPVTKTLEFPGQTESLDVRASSLEDCLGRSDVAMRLAVVQTYWALARAWAERNLIDSQEELILQVAALAFENRNLPGMAEGYLHLRVVERSLELDRAQASLAIARADQRLSHLLKLPPRKEVFLPSTIPYVGEYPLGEVGLATAQGKDPSMPAMEEQISGHREVLKLTLEAVLEADKAWGATLARFSSGGCPLEEVLAAWEMLYQAQRQWISQVIDYNLAIAEYADLVLSKELPPRQFAAALMGGEKEM